MKPVIRKIDFTLAYITEYVALLIVTFPLLNYFGFLSTVLPTIFMAAIMFVVHLWADKIHPSVFIPVTVITILAGWLTGLPILAAVIFGGLLLWRTFDVFKGLTFERIWIILAVSFAVSLVYSYGVPPFIDRFVGRGPIMPLLVIETLCIFITQLMYLGFRLKKNNVRLTSSYVVLSVCSIAFLFLIGNPLMKFLGRLSWHIGPHQYEYPDKEGGLYSNRPPLKQGPPSHFHLANWFVITVVVIAAILIALFIIGIVRWGWKGSAFLKGTQEKSLTSHTEMWHQKSAQSVEKRRLKAPKDPVRLELYRLERVLKKSPHGRSPNDTLGSWFQRLPMRDLDKDIITSIYEKVRYGYKKIAHDEWERYQTAMESVITHLKEQGH